MNVQHYFCKTCGRIYVIKNCGNQENDILCPDSKCVRGRAYLIDEQMAPVIQILNDKGYVTTSCCSSHSWQTPRDSYPPQDVDPVRLKHLGGYIAFKHCYYFQNIPNGWEIDINSRFGPIIEIVLRMKDDVMMVDTPRSELWAIGQILLNDNMSNLLEWCLELPDLEGYDREVDDEVNLNRYGFRKRVGESATSSEKLDKRNSECRDRIERIRNIITGKC